MPLLEYNLNVLNDMQVKCIKILRCYAKIKSAISVYVRDCCKPRNMKNR